MRDYKIVNHHLHHLPLDGSGSVRYLVVLEALGRGWESMRRARGVNESTIESWAVYYNQLTMQAATCKAEDLRRIGQQIASCFKTALWYMEKDGGSQ